MVDLDKLDAYLRQSYLMKIGSTLTLNTHVSFFGGDCDLRVAAVFRAAGFLGFLAAAGSLSLLAADAFLGAGFFGFAASLCSTTVFALAVLLLIRLSFSTTVGFL